jgi:hypothetical protein
MESAAKAPLKAAGCLSRDGGDGACAERAAGREWRGRGQKRPDYRWFDPMYGPAVRCKRVSSIWRTCGLASMYPASDWSVLCSVPHPLDGGRESPRVSGTLRQIEGGAQCNRYAELWRPLLPNQQTFQCGGCVMGYVPFPKFVPTHVTNFGGTTSRLVARRNHADA